MLHTTCLPRRKNEVKWFGIIFLYLFLTKISNRRIIHFKRLFLSNQSFIQFTDISFLSNINRDVTDFLYVPHLLTWDSIAKYDMDTHQPSSTFAFYKGLCHHWYHTTFDNAYHMNWIWLFVFTSLSIEEELICRLIKHIICKSAFVI